VIALRDSTDPDEVILTFPSSRWRDFIDDVKADKPGTTRPAPLVNN